MEEMEQAAGQRAQSKDMNDSEFSRSTFRDNLLEVEVFDVTDTDPNKAG